MRSRFVPAGALAACLCVPAIAVAHELDHSVPAAQTSATNPGFQSGGQGARWELLRTFATNNLQSDLEFFTQGGETYVSAGTLAAGQNGGQTILKLTKDRGATVDLAFVSSHPSASCVTNPGSATGLQHDVEAAPKGTAILNTDFPGAEGRDAQVLIDATDATGRCHDNGTFGAPAPAPPPLGGLEIIDVSGLGQPGSGSLAQPKEIGLTTHIGQAHTVNVDPRRPHIAYAVTSDGVTVDAAGQRANETSGNALDGFEVVDMRSCLTQPLGDIPVGATLAQKRDLCRPQVFRYRWETANIALGHTLRVTGQGVYGCHELEVYPDDRLTCGGGNAAMVFDMSGAFDDNGTPQFTDDKPRGEPLPCRVRISSSGAFGTGAKVTDCQNGERNGQPQSLTVSEWIKIGSPSLKGVRYLGSAHHIGRAATGQQTIPSTEDVDFNHETEFTASGKFLLATDERGGGVIPPGASCSQGVDNTQGNGGIHAYAVERLRKSDELGPPSRAEADAAYANNPRGGKAIYRAPVRTGGEGTECTAHVFQQVPGQNRIFMGWYSQGTQVVDFGENPDGTLEFREAAYFIPVNANQWTSHVFKVDTNPDGTFTYFGVATDFMLGDNGRNSIEVYKVTLPAPPKPGGTFPISTPGAGPAGGPGPGAQPPLRGRRLILSRRALKVGRGGVIRISGRCRSPERCRGVLRLQTRQRAKRGRKVRTLTLARSRPFVILGQRRGVIKLRLSRSGRRAIRRLRRARILAVANLQPARPGARRTTEVTTFRLSSRRAGRRR